MTRPDKWDLVIILLGFLVAMILATLEISHNSNRIDDLEQRVTTFETVRIEMVAPPEGVSR